MLREQKKQQEHTQTQEHTHRNPLRDCRRGQVGPCVCVCGSCGNEMLYFAVLFCFYKLAVGSTRCRVPLTRESALQLEEAQDEIKRRIKRTEDKKE